LPAAVEPLIHWLPPDTETVIVTRGPFRLPRERKDKKGEQNRELAQEFSTYAAKTTPDYDDSSIWHLRMMAQPIYRYPEESDDGAIFAFGRGSGTIFAWLRENSSTQRRGDQTAAGVSTRCGHRCA
jgi:hypothetical protein